MTSKQRNSSGRVGRQEWVLHGNCRCLLARRPEHDLFRVVVLGFTDELWTKVDLDVRIDCEYVDHLEMVARKDLVATHVLDVRLGQMEIFRRLGRCVEPTYDAIDVVSILRPDTLDAADPFVFGLRHIAGTTQNAAGDVKTDEKASQLTNREGGQVNGLGKTYVSPTAKVISSGVKPGFDPSVPTLSLL
jgi:hypothetical protein